MSSKIYLAQVLKAYDYAESHPHKYLRGTTNWCAAVAHSLNEQNPPPELAELQAENDSLRLQCGGMQMTIDELTVENERLKGGQGEPVAYIVEAIDPNNGHARRRGLHWHSVETLRNTRDFKEWIGENITKEQPLYASQPAPVSVRLPERMPNDDPQVGEPFDCAWNACLDKVKELNQ